jgi:hypothetical protein
LALAQRLWDNPEEILPCGDLAHPLFRFGLLQPGATASREGASLDWETPISVPPSLTQPLLFRKRQWPAVFRRVQPLSYESLLLSVTAKLVAARLKVSAQGPPRIVPIVGPRGAPLVEAAAGINTLVGRPLAELELPHDLIPGQPFPVPLATLAWLYGCDLFAPVRDAALVVDQMGRTASSGSHCLRRCL